MIGRLHRAMSRRLRHAGLRLGWIEPRLQYPFAEVAVRHRGGRVNYRWGTLSAAFVARTLGLPRIAVIEFGVAGGNGLLRLEAIAAEVERASGVQIEVYGFDTGCGLPKPVDHRDLPQLWKEGDFGMNEAALRQRLQRAELIIGPVGHTLAGFLARNPAPVGFVSFDMDLYSSTMDAFALFEAAPERLMPRVVCYFDDVIGYSHGDFNGERLAIHDFNHAHERRKISPIYGLRPVLNVQNSAWPEMMYMFHDFDHPRYADYDGTNAMTEIPID